MKKAKLLSSLLVSSLLVGCGGGSSTSSDNVPPEVEDVQFSLNENQNKQIVLSATDVDGNSLSYEIVVSPQHGTFENGVYTPTADYVGTDSFTFIANDGTVNSAPATITITITADFDGDDIADTLDTDDDNDGVEDREDAFPLNPTESVDTDGDGVGNNTDTDDDNDGVEDREDAFPLNPAELVDTDGDGIGNNTDTDDDNDGVDDGEDAFPLNPTESVDTDGDGVGNNTDADDDNDGVSDEDENIIGTNSLDATSTPDLTDTDGDGSIDVIDSDDDNDGVIDSADAFPLDVAESVDSDGDGIGNNADTDDDNDGVLDSSDAFPLDATESIDTDGDGIGNNTDTDDDGDGISDSDEITNGTDPLVPQGVSISGKVEYERVHPIHDGTSSRLDATNITTEVVKEVIVEAIDASGVAIASTFTNSNGEYTLVNLPREKELKIRVYAKMFKENKWDVKVIDNSNSNAQYVIEGALTTTGTTNSTRNLKSTASTKTSPPFAILDSVYLAMKKVLSADSEAKFPSLDMKWSVNNVESGTYYNGDKSIMLQGDQNGDSDEYDDHIIVHEWGHYFEAKFSRADSIGGAHGSGDSLDIRLAFGEGWGNAWSAIATDDPIYFDTMGTYGWNMNIESATKNNPGWFSEASIQRILYDLYDAEDDGSDTLTLGFKPLYNVLLGSQKNTTAFTSIFSFIKALKDENVDDKVAIESMVSSESIANIVDIYGTGRTNRADAYPYYDLTIGSSVNVKTSSSDGSYNKLSNHQYVKFTIGTAGTYTLKVEQTNGTSSDPDFLVYGTSPFKRLYTAESTTAGSEALTKTFEEGSYLIDISDYRNSFIAEYRVTVTPQ